MTRPPVTIQRVERLLTERFGASPGELTQITTGQMSRVFSFRVRGDAYIVRFVTARNRGSIAKDRLIARRLASSAIPVPRIVWDGECEGLYYAISRKAPGRTLQGEHGEGDLPVVDSLIETLDAIHRHDVSDTAGYGEFDGNGRGAFPSWTAFLLDVANEGGDDSFYGAWHRYFDEGAMDRQLFTRIYGEMEARLGFCPAERSLVHADYAYDNVLVDDGRVTAVLDWEHAMYGDFLYDVAWLDLGSPSLDYRSRFKRFYGERGREIDRFEERLLCYQCYISLDAQKWYAYSSQPEAHAWMRERTLHLLSRGPGRT